MTKKKRKNKKRERNEPKRNEEEPQQQEQSSGSAKVVSLDSTVQPQCSWGSAFAAAASVPLEDVDEEFLSRTQSKRVNEGLAKISQLAADSALKKCEAAASQRDEDEGKPEPAPKRPKLNKNHDEEDDNESVGSDSPTLEGRMLPHPLDKGEQVMVLVDTKNRLVYSGTQRTPTGDMLQMGTLENNKVKWNQNAFQADEVSAGDTAPTPTNDEFEAGPSFPFNTDPDDHCESPLESYRDICPLLEQLCHGKKDNLDLYDPYYCDGAVKRNLAEYGFRRVYNRKEDCYRVWKTAAAYPSFQVLVTNPPYSEDHIPKLIKHVTDPQFGERAFFLLMPQWVHKKDYYKNATKQIQPFYLVPKKRYVYLPPKHFRDKKASDVHKKSSPFVSMWFIWGGTRAKTDMLYAHCQRTCKKDSRCEVARSKSALRDLRRKGAK